MIHRSLLLPVLLLAIGSVLPADAARRKGPAINPDFTKGEAIPEGASHDWNLGATGARGWLFADKMSTAQSRQILVTKVDQGSPADGVLKKGDVILGLAGKPFDSDARLAFAKALTAAEAADGKLALLCLRDGSQQQLVVPLEVLGAYSATAPFDCAKSERILKKGCAALAGRMAAANYREGAISRSLNAMALLASGDPQYSALIQREAQWAKDFKADGMATWYYGYVIMFLSEYVMATGDQSVMPGLHRLAMEAAVGQSIVGSWGHKFAGPDGRLVGYGMMNAPGVPLTTSLVMARAAGVKKPEINLAIERSSKLLRFYIGKGAVPYGDHAPWIQTHEDNGKCGMAAVLFNYLDEPKGAEYFSRMSLASHGPERECGHTGNFWNMTWAMPAVAQSGPNATGAWMKEFGAWYFDLARRWDGTFPHQGPAQPEKDKTAAWDASGAYLLAYAMPLKKLWITGKRDSKALKPLTAAEAQEIIALGRGWSNDDRNSAYDGMNMEMLFDALGSWSPIVRERAAMAIQRRGGAPLESLLKLLKSGDLNQRIGVCQALAQMGERAAPAVPALIETLDADDLWLRVKAAEAIAQTGEAGNQALPKLLDRIAQGPTKEDPRAMEQRFLLFEVFGRMFKQSVAAADPEQLRKAIIAGLKNEDGRARGSVGSIYDKLSNEQVRQLMPVIHEAVVKPAPSGIMFADGVRAAGLKLMAKQKVAEGMELCIPMMELDRWNKKSRIGNYLDVIEMYGSAAKPLAPQLRQLAKELRAHQEASGLADLAVKADAMAEKLEHAPSAGELRRLKEF